MRSIWLIAVVLALLVASCSGGSSPDGAAPRPETEPALAEANPDAPTAVSYAELAGLVADGEVSELTLAVSEFAALYEVDVPGAMPLLDDDSLPELGTDVERQLTMVLFEELDDEQRSVITARLDEIDAASEEVYHSLDDPEYLAAVEESAGVGGEPEGLREPADLRSYRLAASEPPEDLSGLEVRAIAGNAILTIQRRLGGVELDVFYRVGPLPGRILGRTNYATSNAGHDSCTVTINPNNANFEDAVLRSIVAHETFHCWFYLNRSSQSSWFNAVGFFDEGMPTWVGEEYAGGSGFGDRKWVNYVQPESVRLGRIDYDAYGFWLQVAQLRGGSEAIWALIPSLAAVADDPVAVWDKAFAGLGIEAQAALAPLTVRQPDWSLAWDVSLGQPAAGRRIVERSVTVADPATHTIGLGEQSVVRFTFGGLSSDTSYVLTEEIGGLATARFDGAGATDDVVTAATTSQWCVAGPCECSDGASPVPGLQFAPTGSTSRTVALTSSFAMTSNVARVELTDVAELCDEEGEAPDVGAPGGGFVGRWKANPNAIEAMFEQASGFGVGDGEGLDVAGVRGDLLMEFLEDGTGTLTYDRVTLFINNAVLGDLTVNGSGTFAWGIVGDTVRISGNTYEISVSSEAFGDFATFTEADTPGGGLTELTGAIAGDMLTISAEGTVGEVFFPNSWTRN